MNTHAVVSTESNAIIKTKNDGRSRTTFLPQYFGSAFIHFESYVYRFMDQLAGDQYTGGYWEYYHLSNGAPLMELSPCDDDPNPWQVTVASNYFDGEMSAEALSITANLFALGHLSAKLFNAGNNTLNARINRYYEALSDYASEHPEASAIRAAID